MLRKKIAFTTLGCKVNMYDTEAMIELFEKKGYEITNFNEFADIYLINTCTVTNSGDKKSRQAIRRAKKINPKAIVVATGCYAQVRPQEIEKTEGINIIVGTKDRKNIVEIVENYSDDTKVINIVGNIMKEKTFEELSVHSLKDHTRAYLKIQEGCNRFCSYCIIPYARGPVRSRNPKEIIKEVETLAKNGFKEIVLAGIHVASYGIDLKDITLIDIIQQVHKIKGIERIRFSSIEPFAITEKFVSALKELPKVCDHFHLSLQSGCNKTLKRMNRRYTCDEYKKAVDKLKSIYPDVAITTDIIVGFPGENENDFKESMTFAGKIKFAKIHVFPYSPKTGTKAAEFSEQIPPDTKNLRSSQMINLSNELNKEFLSNYIGKTKEVLFERCLGDNIYEGHTTNYIAVRTKSETDISNKILNVKIIKILKEETVLGTIQTK